MAEWLVWGVDHHGTPVAVRERLAVAPDALPALLAELRGEGGLREAVVLSTCNRFEVYGAADAPEAAFARLLARLAGRIALPPERLRRYVVTRTGRAAARHCFRVAASLESRVVGEPQILGQVKDAFASAVAAQAVGPLLHRLFAQAFSVAKKVRHETDIGRLGVSVAAVAVELAEKIFGDLRRCAVLLIGAGDTGALAARHFREHGVAALVVANRSPERAARVAAALGGTAVPLAAWRERLADADVVVTCARSERPLVTRGDVAAVARARGGSRPLFFIDLAVPRNVDPAVRDLDGVFVRDVDALQALTEVNWAERDREAARAALIVERAVAGFVAADRDAGAAPLLAAFRQRAEAIRRGEVERTLAALRGAPPELQRACEALSLALVNKLLHAPTERLREAVRRGDVAACAAAADLFGLSPIAEHPSVPRYT